MLQDDPARGVVKMSKARAPKRKNEGVVTPVQLIKECDVLFMVLRRSQGEVVAFNEREGAMRALHGAMRNLFKALLMP